LKVVEKRDKKIDRRGKKESHRDCHIYIYIQMLGIEEILYTLSQNRLKLNYADTAVLVSRGGRTNVPLWVSTDSHGKLKSKASDDIPVRDVVDRFKRIAAVHNPGQKSRKAFVLRFRGERRELSVKGLQKFLKENKSIQDGIATLQPCIRPKKKGAGGLFRTTRVPSAETGEFEYVTTRMKAGKTSMECIAPSLLTHINHALSNITEQVLSVLEDVHELTVSYASLDFVVDRNGTTWLTEVHSLQTKHNEDLSRGVGGVGISLPSLRPSSEQQDRKKLTKKTAHEQQRRPRSAPSIDDEEEEEEEEKEKGGETKRSSSQAESPKRRGRRRGRKRGISTSQHDDAKSSSSSSSDDELMRFASMVTRLTQENGDLAKRLQAAETKLKSRQERSSEENESVEKYKEDVRALQRKLVSLKRKHENEMQIKENEQQTQMLQLEARLNSALVMEGDDTNRNSKSREKQMESVRELVETIKKLQVDNELERRKSRATREELVVKHTKEIKETQRQHQRVLESLRKKVQNHQDMERKMKNESVSFRAEIMSMKSQSQDLFSRIQDLELENKRLGEALSNSEINESMKRDNGSNRDENDESEENTSSIHTIKALCDAKVRQMNNEVEYLKDQLASESSCKEKLAESLAQLNNQFLQAKSQAKSLLQEQDASHRKEIQEMQRRCQRQVDTQKSETVRMEEKIKRLQINLTEMMKDVSSARQREKESESERLVLEEERRVLQERVEGLKATELDLSEQLTRHEKRSQMEAALKSTMDLKCSRLENEIRFVKSQTESDRQRNLDLEKALEEAQVDAKMERDRLIDVRLFLYFSLDVGLSIFLSPTHTRTHNNNNNNNNRHMKRNSNESRKYRKNQIEMQ
jgi:hypothetical protein